MRKPSDSAAPAAATDTEPGRRRGRERRRGHERIEDIDPDFEPVPLRPRADGWTGERQCGLIEALAETGCVEDACRSVGMSVQSAYKLRRDPRAASFRMAWDLAVDYAMRRLSDAVVSRALHGVAVPVFYQGEQIGERRRYDERLAMFLLRCRDPARYGRALDRLEVMEGPEDRSRLLTQALNAILGDDYLDRYHDEEEDADEDFFEDDDLDPEGEHEADEENADDAPDPAEGDSGADVA